MVKSKYGEIPDVLFLKYMDRIVDNFFRSLCLKEEKCQTIDLYLENFQRELVGSKKLIAVLMYDPLFLSILGTLESLIGQNDLVKFKSDVFKSISMTKKLQEKYMAENQNQIIDKKN